VSKGDVEVVVVLVIHPLFTESAKLRAELRAKLLYMATSTTELTLFYSTIFARIIRCSRASFKMRTISLRSSLGAGKFEKANALLVKIQDEANSTSKGKQSSLLPAPLTPAHLTFLASRCFELWGEGGGGEGPRRVSRAGYRKVFGRMLMDNDRGAQAAAAEAEAAASAQEGKEKLEPVDVWLGRMATWEKLGGDCHAAGLDLFASDLLFVGINRVVVGDSPAKKGGGEGGGGGGGNNKRRKSIVASSVPGQGGGRVPVESYLDLAKYYHAAGQVDEARETLEIAREADPNNARVDRSLKLIKGEIRSNPSVRKMKGKSLGELVGMILA